MYKELKNIKKLLLLDFKSLNIRVASPKIFEIQDNYNFFSSDNYFLKILAEKTFEFANSRVIPIGIVDFYSDIEETSLENFSSEILNSLYYLIRKCNYTSYISELFDILKLKIRKLSKETQKIYYDALLYFADIQLTSGKSLEASLYYESLERFEESHYSEVNYELIKRNTKISRKYDSQLKNIGINFDNLVNLHSQYEIEDVYNSLQVLEVELKKFTEEIEHIENKLLTSEIRDFLFIVSKLKRILFFPHTFVFGLDSFIAKTYSSDIMLFDDDDKLFSLSFYGCLLTNYKTQKMFFEPMISFYYKVENIKHLLKIEDKSFVKDICYYTSLDTFYYLFFDKDATKCSNQLSDLILKKDKGILSIMNSSYMNDPTEGKLLFSLLDFNENQGDSNRKLLSRTPVYLKSFTALVDYLPMWNLYGDQGKGVCVRIKCDETFTNSDLYNVCYIKDDGDINELDNRNISPNSLTKIEKTISDLKLIFKSLPKNDIYKMLVKYYFMEIIDSISYLFKNANYSYEKETRVIFTKGEIKEECISTANNYKLMCIKAPFKLKIEEVILGPCFKSPNMYVPFLMHLLNEDDGKSDVKITQSNIDFR